MRILTASLLMVMSFTAWSAAHMKEQESAAAKAMGSVSRSAFTSGIENREPVDALPTDNIALDRVYYFTELLDLNGETVTHRWVYNGSVMAELTYNVGSNRWRVWSSKNMNPMWPGEWTVLVLDSAGNTISSDTFQYQGAKP